MPNLVNALSLLVVKIIFEVRKTKALHAKPIDLLWERAASSSADYIESHLASSMLFRKREDLWRHALKLRQIQGGLNLEFGVFKGESINFFARTSPESKFVGFDSFEGLKEDWFGTDGASGYFNLNGRKPRVEKNVSLVSGWFDETLPTFLSEYQNLPISFLHIDCDTFESTFKVLDLVAARLKPGTIIVFDEYLGFPNWQASQFKAWEMCVENYSIKFKYIAFSQAQALVQINCNGATS